MSFYWRWVVIRTAVAASTLAVYTLAAFYGSGTWLFELPTSFTDFSILLTDIPPILAEAYVLRRAFPKLSSRAYVGYSLVLLAFFVLLDLALVLADGGITQTATDAALPGSEEEPNLGLLIVFLLVAVATIPIFIVCLFLPWRALGRVAEGRKLWRIMILAGILGALSSLLGVYWLVGVDMETSDYSSWTNAGIQFAADVVSQLTYALISGIGIARLRPILKDTP